MKILIVGAAGNLGSLLSKYLISGPHDLRLLIHRQPFPLAIPRGAKVETARADLNEPASLPPVCADIDCIVHLAGVLFEPRPERYLHRTNTIYVQNIVDAAKAAGVRKFILVSFPHVEENTSPQNPAKGLLAVAPKSLHARSRLAAEKYLFSACEDGPMQPLVLRAGVVYGSGVKLTEAARWLMRKRLLAVWRQPTWVHLLALPDFLRIVEVAIERDNISGIFNVCDDQPLFLQEFLDRLACQWGYRKPWRLPAFSFFCAAEIMEAMATIFHSRTPLTKDMLCMAMTSVVADTSRMKRELIAELAYPTLMEGLKLV